MNELLWPLKKLELMQHMVCPKGQNLPFTWIFYMLVPLDEIYLLSGLCISVSVAVILLEEAYMFEWASVFFFLKVFRVKYYSSFISSGY